MVERTKIGDEKGDFFEDRSKDLNAWGTRKRRFEPSLVAEGQSRGNKQD